jgi:hypothetical protein
MEFAFCLPQAARVNVNHPYTHSERLTHLVFSASSEYPTKPGIFSVFLESNTSGLCTLIWGSYSAYYMMSIPNSGINFSRVLYFLEN